MQGPPDSPDSKQDGRRSCQTGPVQEIVFTSTLPIHIQDIYSYDMCLQEEENLNLEVPSRASILEEHSPDVLRRRNGEQPHIAFAGTSDQNVIACNVQGPMRHSFVTPSYPSYYNFPFRAK